MKKILSGLFFLLTVSIAFGQSLELPQAVDPFVMYNADESGIGYARPHSKISYFPLVRFYGWSRDSKIAYSIENEIPGRGGVLIRYFIQDLITDQILWQLDDDSNDWNETAFSKSKSTEGEYSFTLQGKKLADALKDHKIETGNYELKKLPIRIIKSATDRYEVEIETDILETGEKLYDMLKLIDYRIFAHKSNNRSKVILEKTGVVVENVYACGYYLSPYEERAVVVIGEESYVFEGNGINYEMVGCSLTAGFR